MKVGAGPGTADRATFVLGIFPGQAAASDAIRRLASPLGKAPDAILVSRADFPECFAARPPFGTLWASLSHADGADMHQAPRGTERLAQHLTRRLGDGASVVVVQTEEPGHRLAVSRALLEAGCEVLLTHEATPPGADTTGNHRQTPVMKR